MSRWQHRRPLSFEALESRLVLGAAPSWSLSGLDRSGEVCGALVAGARPGEPGAPANHTDSANQAIDASTAETRCRFNEGDLELAYLGDPPLPDFAIVALEITPEHPNPGEEASIRVVIQNVGQATSCTYAELDILDQGNSTDRLVEVYTVEFCLGPGEFVEEFFSWTPDQEGLYSAGVLVDPEGLVQELDEWNNYESAGMTVGSPPLPDFRVEPLEITPEHPDPGQEVSIRVAVENVGEGTYWTYAELDVVDHGDPTGQRIWVETLDVTLGPGERTEEVFFWTPDQEGLYSASVFVDPEMVIEELEEWYNYEAVGMTVGNPPLPDFRVEPVEITPEHPDPGQEVSIRVAVENVGQGTYWTYAELDIVDHGDPTGQRIWVETLDVTLGPGERTEEVFFWTPDQEGLYSASVFVDPEMVIEELEEWYNFEAAGMTVGNPPLPEFRVLEHLELLQDGLPVSGNLAVGKAVAILGGFENAGSGQYHTYAELDVYRFSDPSEIVWAGALEGSPAPGEKIEGEFTHDGDRFPPRWIPEEEGTYLLTVFVDPERLLPEEDGKEWNNFLIVGVEVGPREIDPVEGWDELISQLGQYRPLLELRGTVDDGSLDGLERSFITTGRGTGDPEYEDWRALVALGRVYAFDVATSVLARLVEGPQMWDDVAHRLDVYQRHIENHEHIIGDEIIVDFFNTIFDKTPFNPGDDPELIRGVTGNVSSIIQAYAAYRFETEDSSFDEFLQRLLFGKFDEQGEKVYEGLLDRQVIEPGSELHGLFLSRPRAYFESKDISPFAILENNLRAHDALRLAIEAIGDSTLKGQLIERYQLLHDALRRQFVDNAPGKYAEAVDENGSVSNEFNSQDLYTIGGIFLLRAGEIEKARAVLDFLDSHFIVGHAPDAPEGCYYDIEGDPDPTCEEYPNAGVAFFIGQDDEGDLAFRPIDFDDPEVISSQSEAVLDYMLFVTEYAEAVPAEREYAEARFDLMADSLGSGLCQLYNQSSDVGLLPASTRAIQDLFTTFDAALATNQAIIVDFIRDGKDAHRVYRGPRLPLVPTELAQDLGPITLMELEHENPSEGDLWYRLETTCQGLLTLEAIPEADTGNAELQLFCGHGVALVASAESIEWQTDAGARYYLRLTGSSTDVDLRLVNLVDRVGHAGAFVLACGADGKVDVWPEGLVWVDEWDSFAVEIWGRPVEAADVGITGFCIDLAYNTDCYTAAEIQYGPGFTENQTGSIDDAQGRVDHIGAETTQDDVGRDRSALLARVPFEVSEHDPGLAHNADGHYITPIDFQLEFADGQIWLSNGPPVPLELNRALDCELWPVMYDVDDDGCIFFGDLAFFATAYQQKVGEPGAQFAWACDFDHSGRVDVGDLAFFAENFQRCRGDAIVYPGNFPEAWRSGHSGSEVPAASQSSAALLAEEQRRPLTPETVTRPTSSTGRDAAAASGGDSHTTVDLPARWLARASWAWVCHEGQGCSNWAIGFRQVKAWSGSEDDTKRVDPAALDWLVIDGWT